MGRYILKETEEGWRIVELNRKEELEGEGLEISTEEYIKFGLYEKAFLSEEDYSTLCDYIETQKAKKLAHKLTRFKNKSTLWVRNKLLENNISNRVVEKVIEELEERNLLGDRDIIQRFIRDRMKFNPKSQRFLKFELLKRGFLEQDIEICIGEMCMKDMELAGELFERKLRRGLKTDAIVKFLKNRGFDFEVIKAVVENHKDIM